MHALSRIPPAPRRPHWAAVLWFRWPLLVAGILFGIVCGLASVMVGLASEAKRHDALLDSGPNGRVSGQLVGQLDVARSNLVRATAQFRPPNAKPTEPSHVITSFIPADRCTPELDIEYLRENPTIARVAGGRLAIHPNIHRPMQLFVVIPGLVGLLAWLYGVCRMFATLRRGDLATCEEIEVHPSVWPVPDLVQVVFQFRDHRARLVSGRSWIRARSASGTQLVDSPRPRDVVVAYDRRAPGRWHRVVHPSDFCASTARDDHGLWHPAKP